MASLPSDPPDVYTSAAELIEEIDFQKVVLLSIDDSVADKEAAVAKVKAGIKDLERQLRIVKARDKTSATSTPPGSQQTHAHSAPAFNLDPFALDDPFGSFVPGHGLSCPKPSNASSTSSTPDSAASAEARTFQSPSQLNLPSRKRAYGNKLTPSAPPDYRNKSRRMTPSSQSTSSRTPSTSSMDDDQLVLRQLELEAQIKRERSDEAFARRLQQEMHEFPVPSQSSPARSVNTTPIGSQTAFDRLLGRHNHSVPSRAKRPTDNQLNAPSLHRSSSAVQSHHVRPVNSEALELSGGHHSKMPGSYVSDDDSEIEVIDSSTFQDNGRYHPSASKQHMSTSSWGLPSNVPCAETQRSFSSHQPWPGRQGPSSPNVQQASSFHSTSAPNYNTPANTVFTDPGDAHQAALQRRQSAHGVKDETRNGRPLPWQADMRPGYLHNGEVPGPGLVHPDHSQRCGRSRFEVLPSGGLGYSHRDQLSKIISQTSSYNYGAMTDMYGNPLDPRIAMDVHDFVTDPRKTAQEIKDLLENIRPDTEIAKEDREGTPDGLKYPLYEHQKLALTWLKSMEEGTNKGGILADDMGLGKTISALALILSRPSDDRARRTTLIVGPVALIRQWEREIKTKVNFTHRLSTFVYHSGKRATFDTLRNFDVVLTTYGTIGAEYGRREAWDLKLKENPQMDQSDERKKFPFLGKFSKWYRVILDEAQCIKNKKTKAAQGANLLQSVTRFCLTGTPMMNGIHELYSLISFLKIRPYCSSTRFSQDFGCLSRNSGSTSVREQKVAMKKLQAVLKAMMLRRTKTSEIDGKPILTLPEKTEEIVHVLFNEDEHAYYSALEGRTQLQFNKYLKAGTIGKNYSNILVLLLRLRQAACHPHLIMDFDEAPAEATIESMSALAKTLTPDVVSRIIQATVPFECPVCYDPVPNPRIVVPCGHDTCSECLVRITANQEQQSLADGNESSAASCPSCRGHIDLEKIIDYETFKSVYMIKDAAENDGEDAASEDDSDARTDLDESDTDSDTADERVEDGNDADIAGFIVPDDYQSDADDIDDSEDHDPAVGGPSDKGKGVKREAGNVKEETSIKPEPVKMKEEMDDDEDLPDLGNIPTAASSATKKRPFPEMVKTPSMFKASRQSKRLKKSKKTKRQDRKGKGKAKEKGPKLSLAMLKKQAVKSAENRRRYMKYLREHWVSSAKTDICMDLLRQTDADVKTIIFSQFTTLLDLMEVPIRSEMGRQYVRYDGSMSADARNNAVVKFTDEPDCRIMLVSLKAGNAGLNLVAASQVIILDPFWNPYIEMQAVDRAHRIGQRKPVKVHRILVEKTVEDRIMELQERKRKLVDSALDEKASQGLARLGQQELIFLFGADNGQERATANRPQAPLYNIEDDTGYGTPRRNVYPIDSSPPNSPLLS